MRFDHMKVMSVHVSTCASYDFSALSPVCVDVVTLIRCVCFYILLQKWMTGF